MSTGKSGSGGALTEEDRLLWNRIGETVTPLRSRPSAHRPDRSDTDGQADTPRPGTPRRSPPGQPPAGTDAGLSASVGKTGRSRLDDRTARKLKKGTLSIDSRIDLHGMTQDRAHARLRRFLEIAHHRGDRIVLVVTGKGRNGDGVLRRAVPHWLGTGQLRSIATAWRQAHASHGGEGALYVRLRRRRTGGPGR